MLRQHVARKNKLIISLSLVQKNQHMCSRNCKANTKLLKQSEGGGEKKTACSHKVQSNLDIIKFQYTALVSIFLLI